MINFDHYYHKEIIPAGAFGFVILLLLVLILFVCLG